MILWNIIFEKCCRINVATIYGPLAKYHYSAKYYLYIIYCNPHDYYVGNITIPTWERKVLIFLGN